jgi:hypothetical protein
MITQLTLTFLLTLFVGIFYQLFTERKVPYWFSLLLGSLTISLPIVIISYLLYLIWR